MDEIQLHLSVDFANVIPVYVIVILSVFVFSCTMLNLVVIVRTINNDIVRHSQVVDSYDT